VVGRDPENAFARKHVAKGRAAVALALAAGGDAVGAVVEQRRAVAELEAIAALPGSGRGATAVAAEARATLGDLVAARPGAKLAEACREWEVARARLDAAEPDPPPERRVHRDALSRRIARCGPGEAADRRVR
jgi:hypothetical protein